MSVLDVALTAAAVPSAVAAAVPASYYVRERQSRKRRARSLLNIARLESELRIESTDISDDLDRDLAELLGPEFETLIRLTADDFTLSGMLRGGGWLGFKGSSHAS